MAIEKIEQILNTNHWYTDKDVNSVLAATKEKQGVEKNKNFTLAGKREGWTVLITPAVNGQLSVPDHDRGVDYYLDKQKQPSGIVENAGRELNESRSHSDEEKKEIINSLEDRKDVFDEILDLLKSKDEQNIKILFPINLGIHKDSKSANGSHWVTGEIQVIKNNDGVGIKVFQHDSIISNGKMNDENYHKIKKAVEKRLEGIIYSIDNSESPYEKCQMDGSSCGPIACDRIMKLALGNILNDENYKPGTEDLRRQQLALMNGTSVEENKTSGSALKAKMPKWEKFADKEATETLKKVFAPGVEGVKKVHVELNKVVVTRDNNDEITFQKNNSFYEMRTESTDKATLKAMVKKMAEFLKNSQPKKLLEVEIETDDPKVREMLIECCKAERLKIKDMPQPSKKTQPHSDEEMFKKVENKEKEAKIEGSNATKHPMTGMG